ncbi:MAG: aspartyl/asparaginyl beta-hydroxylase domain-containing protein [Chitinophagales bacterium]|nr:aspartyl/asparaginyl beta-hydroxylase domain-containing protein [Chitinophagales bacterium]
MSKSKLWFSDYDNEYHQKYHGILRSDQVSFIQDLELLYPKIKDEVAILWMNKQSQLYGSFDQFDQLQYPPKSWKKLVIKVWDVWSHKTRNFFPNLTSFIDKHPDILSCYITKTAPLSVIKQHYGETNATYRIHLGLNVPIAEKNECSIKVSGEVEDWKNGKSFAFIDAEPHEVWNKTNQERYVLIIDVLRPEFIKKRKFICARIISTQFFFSIFSRFLKKETLHNIPSAFYTILTYITYWPIYLLSEAEKKYGVLRFL